MNEAKIRLSPAEMELVSDEGLILTKNRILGKVMELFGMIQPLYSSVLQNFTSLPAAIHSIPPKISRGENYKGLPWLVLDYPRCFGQQDIFAVRTLFWWGRFFSISLQLAGKYQADYAGRISRSHARLSEQDFHLCIHESPWHHHFENDNYQPVNTFTEAIFEQACRERPFLKIARRFPLQEWESMPELMTGAFRELTGLLADQLPRR